MYILTTGCTWYSSLKGQDLRDAEGVIGSSLENLEDRSQKQGRRVADQIPFTLVPFWPPGGCSAALESCGASVVAGAVEIRLGSRLVADG